MKTIRVAVFIGFICCAAHSASLLQPQSFPKTANDLTFTQRTNLLAAGYEPWESEYDANGHCISGCIYSGITIKDELNVLQQNTNNARRNLVQYIQNQPQQQNIISQPQQSGQSPAVIIAQNAPRCEPHNTNTPAGQTMPLGVPLTGNPRVTSPYGQRTNPVTGKQQVHRGIDFSATVGTPVYSPAIGTVKSVWRDSTCGNGLKIAHANGYETVYCHLNTVTVKNGDSVGAGCVVAETGNSGRTTGPHLHYAIKYNGEYINPTDWVNNRG